MTMCRTSLGGHLVEIIFHFGPVTSFMNEEISHIKKKSIFDKNYLCFTPFFIDILK